MNNAKTDTTDAMPEQRWQTVQQRQPVTCSFVYAVRTTGIYCRPGCPSRLPNRENVSFFDTPMDARKAGFRSCKRCDPDGHFQMDPQVACVLEACRQIDRAPKPPTLEELSTAIDMSASHLHRLFQQVLGITPKGYAAMKRAERVRHQLQARNPSSITEVALSSGYEANSRFYAEADSILGMKPAQYRYGAPEVRLHLVFAQTSLGLAAIAMTEKGVCCIEFGESEDALRTHIQGQFPYCRIEPSALHDQWMQSVITAIDHPTNTENIPLDIQGTAFQRRVWEKIREIPCGETMTYATLAQKIEQPNAARAVANACAANRLAIVIPCHRVRRSDGKIGGYRWGESRKIELCRRERQLVGNASEDT